MSRRLPTATDGPPTTARELPELQPAQRALARLERALLADRSPAGLSPLYLHGPTGCGKSYLIERLLDRLGGTKTVLVLSGRDLGRLFGQPEGRIPAETANLLVIEEVTSFPAAQSDSLSALLDRRLAVRGPVVITATQGPALLLRHGARLCSRLAAGLVLAIPPLGPESRRSFLQAQTRAAGLNLSEAVLGWLAEQAPGSFRQLQGLVERLVKQAARRPSLSPADLSLAEVQAGLQESIEKEPTTLEQITRLVARFYRVQPARLRGKSRQRAMMVPRQVSMYLARLRTGLSLEAIGAYFGGRDHTTVLHACRKVEKELEQDPALAGAVKTLQAGLG